MNEIFARVWENLSGRLTGPMNLRLIIQPRLQRSAQFVPGCETHIKNRPPFLWPVRMLPKPCLLSLAAVVTSALAFSQTAVVQRNVN
jgi:hypothetical protein